MWNKSEIASGSVDFPEWMQDVSMVVLAGGSSSRMGMDKSDLSYKGKTFLQIQIEKGEQLGISEILVSGYRGKDCSQPVIPDRYLGKGPLGGMESCFRYAKGSCCLVLGVDMPFIPVSELKQLLKCYQNTEKRVVILKAAGREQPMVGVYDVTLADEMEEEFLQRKGSVFALLNRITYDVYECKLDSEYAVNINDPKIYRKYCKIL